MRYTILIVLFFCLGNSCYAQKNPEVEVKLRLLDSTLNGKKYVALGVSIVNRTNSDIYIPGLNTFAISGVHYYRKKNKIWQEIDCYTREPVQPDKQKGGMPLDIGYTRIPDNVLNKKYENSEKALHFSQDSILKAYCNTTKQDYWKYIGIGIEPIFIKANQTISNYVVCNLDSLLNTREELKISFNSEERDKKTLKFRNSLILSKKSPFKFPAHIFKFKRVLLQKITSNTLYYPDKMVALKTL